MRRQSAAQGRVALQRRKENKEQYHTGSFTTYYGRALAIVRAGVSGTLKVMAADGRLSGSAEIEITGSSIEVCV